MLSNRKHQLLVAERLAIASAIVCLSIAMLSWLNEAIAKLALPIVLIAFAIIFYLALLIAGLTGELAKSLGLPAASSDESAFISWRDLRKQWQWSPRLYKLLAVTSLLATIAMVFTFGAVSWTTGEIFTREKAIGSSLYLCFITLIELPVIASAARMPGAFQDHF